MYDQRVPFAFRQFSICIPLEYGRLAYEDVRSIEEKAKYIKRHRFSGAALYTINADDFNNFCEQGKFPLLRTLDFYLNPHSQVELPNADDVFNETSRKLIHDKATNELKELVKADVKDEIPYGMKFRFISFIINILI